MMKKMNQKGFLLTEVIVSLGVLVLILASMCITLGGFRNINHYYHNSLRCTAAAQAQLNNIAITGRGIDEQVLNRLWPKVDLSVEKSPAVGQWHGLTLITVTAKTKSPIRDVEIKLGRYLAQTKENQ